MIKIEVLETDWLYAERYVELDRQLNKLKIILPISIMQRDR